MKDYKEKTITWQAYSVMKVEEECINTGKFPNGTKMKAKDIEESKQQIENCKQILLKFGVLVNIQLELF